MKRENRHILIIGATGGIGSAIVLAAINCGYKVVVTGRKKRSLEKIQKQYGKDEVLTHLLDLEKPATFQALPAFIKKRRLKLAWVINSAGFIDPREPRVDQKNRDIQKTFQINTESVIALTYLLSPLISKGGGVISISSTAGIWNNQKYPVYGASKAALNSFMQSFAEIKKSENLTVITICPGPTNTNMRKKISHDAHTKQDPSVISDIVKTIVQKSNTYRNGDILVARDGNVSIQSRLSNKNY